MDGPDVLTESNDSTIRWTIKSRIIESLTLRPDTRRQDVVERAAGQDHTEVMEEDMKVEDRDSLEERERKEDQEEGEEPTGSPPEAKEIAGIR